MLCAGIGMCFQAPQFVNGRIKVSVKVKGVGLGNAVTPATRATPLSLYVFFQGPSEGGPHFFGLGGVEGQLLKKIK